MIDFTLVATLGALIFIGSTGWMTFGKPVLTPQSWIIPATLSMVFLAFTIYSVVSEGISGPLAEHVRNAWGNQIWLDLLLAIGIAWFLILPESKARGMRPWLWLALIVCTGCIGFLAMLSRLLYLRGREDTVNIS